MYFTVLKIQGILEKLITPDDLTGNAKRVLCETVACLQVRIFVHQYLPYITKYKTIFPLIHHLRSGSHFITAYKIKHILCRYFPKILKMVILFKGGSTVTIYATVTANHGNNV